jgi:hypothetical protein
VSFVALISMESLTSGFLVAGKIGSPKDQQSRYFKRAYRLQQQKEVVLPPTVVGGAFGAPDVVC